VSSLHFVFPAVFPAKKEKEWAAPTLQRLIYNGHREKSKPTPGGFFLDTHPA
jgi:hypothetical protein